MSWNERWDYPIEDDLWTPLHVDVTHPTGKYNLWFNGRPNEREYIEHEIWGKLPNDKKQKLFKFENWHDRKRNGRIQRDEYNKLVRGHRMIGYPEIASESTGKFYHW